VALQQLATVLRTTRFSVRPRIRRADCFLVYSAIISVVTSLTVAQKYPLPQRCWAPVPLLQVRELLLQQARGPAVGYCTIFAMLSVGGLDTRM
jgi:hypothetical protein